ncbi:alpha/beta hydrolase [Corynebacterium diphtheriae]|nr:alpha/beta hydrolase [Corynebacterium diphtheriae]
MWIILPGWACPPSDYERIATPADRIVDAWDCPLSNGVDQLREYLGVADGTSVNLFGHSYGGLLAIEWAARYPEQVDSMVLADPSEPHEISSFPLPNALAHAASYPVGAVAPWIQWAQRAVRNVPQPDHLRRRFGGARTIRFLADEFFAVEQHQRDVARYLAQQGPIAFPPTIHLVGAGKGLNRTFLRRQRQLGQRLGATTYYLWNEGHMFPQQSPELVRPFLVKK